MNAPRLPLYHYTRRVHLPSIFANGLDSGEVQVAPAVGCNGRLISPPRYMLGVVWLTTDLDPAGHGLDLDKREIRIQVAISPLSKRLVRWSTFARKRLGEAAEDDADALASEIEAEATGGAPERKGGSWWFHRGVIRPDRFAEVRDLRNGCLITPGDVADEPLIRGERIPFADEAELLLAA